MIESNAFLNGSINILNSPPNIDSNPAQIPSGKSKPNQPRIILNKSYTAPSVTSMMAFGRAVSSLRVPDRNLPSEKSLNALLNVPTKDIKA